MPGYEVIDPRSVSDWNTTLPATSNVSVFHTAEWARVLSETYRWKPVYIRSAEGMLPLMEVQSWATPVRGISLPFSDFCEPLSASETECRKLLDAALDLGKTRHWKTLELRSDIAGSGEAVPAWDQFYSHELDLGSGTDAVFNRFAASVRQAIRKSERMGVTVSLCDDSASLREFFNLHVITRRKHGVPPQPFKFMGNIQEHLLARGKGFIALAKHQGAVIAACMFLHFGQKALYKFGASNPDAQHLRGTNAAFWAAIKFYVDHGITSLHMGRTDMTNEGLRRFKLGWGTRERVTTYRRYDYSRADFIHSHPATMGRIAPTLFKHLPTSVLRAIGAALYRHAA